MTHTPGPWRQGGVKEFCSTGKCREIVADEGHICLVYGTEDEDNKANARLIAAAPDLLEACELFENWMLGPFPHSDSKVLEIVTAAIKRAKGN